MSLPESLTAREREIVALALEGLYNKEIAAKLQISVRTVKYHRSSINAKCGVPPGDRGLLRIAALARGEG